MIRRRKPREPLKVCKRCKKGRIVSKFRSRILTRFNHTIGKNVQLGPYLNAWCKDCESAYGREWRRLNPGYHAAKSKGYRAL